MYVFIICVPVTLSEIVNSMCIYVISGKEMPFILENNWFHLSVMKVELKYYVNFNIVCTLLLLYMTVMLHDFKVTCTLLLLYCMVMLCYFNVPCTLLLLYIVVMLHHFNITCTLLLLYTTDDSHGTLL